MKSASELRTLLKVNYERRSLTPLFLRGVQRSKSICSATCHLVKLPLQDEEEKRIKTARRREYDQQLRRREFDQLRRRSKSPAPAKPSLHAIVGSMHLFLFRKRAAVFLQANIRAWLRRRTIAARKIAHWFQHCRATRKQRLLRKWLFLLCLCVRVTYAKWKKSARQPTVSLPRAIQECPSPSTCVCLQLQSVVRSFLARELVASLPRPAKPRGVLTKRKTLVEDFKHFVLSSQIEQAVMAFRWNLEVSKKNKQLLHGLKEFQKVCAKVLKRYLRPALLQLKSHYEECERARQYRPSKQRQSQRFLIRDKKTIQSLSHKLALTLSTRGQHTATPTPGPGLLEKVKTIVSNWINN